MKLKISKETLQDALTAIDVVSSEPCLTFTEDGVLVRMMNGERVVMLDFFLPKEVFESYDVPDHKVQVSLNIDELQKIIKRASKETMITLEFQPTSRVDVEIRGGDYLKRFDMPSLQADDEGTPIPKVKPTAKATVTTSGLKSVIEDAQLATDHAHFTIAEEKVDVVAPGDWIAADIDLKVGDQILISTEVKEQAKACFPLGYLSKILSAVKSPEVTYLHLSTDMPLRLEFQLDYPGKLEYWIAPRIEV